MWLRHVGALLLGAVAIAAALAPPVAHGDTVIEGNIDGYVTWQEASSPYLLKGGVTITPGSTLVIKKGVKVKVAAGGVLRVYGHLGADGTQAEPIRFTSDGSLAYDHWSGIEVGPPASETELASASLAYCIIERAGRDTGYAGGAVRCKSLKGPAPWVKLYKTTIQKSATNGLYLERVGLGAVHVEECTIQDCGRRPVQLVACGGPTFKGKNLFRDNGQRWIGVSGLGMDGIWDRAPVPYSWDTTESGPSVAVTGGRLMVWDAIVLVPTGGGIVAQRGTLQADLTLFTSWEHYLGNPPAAGRWAGIRAYDGAKCQLVNCEVYDTGQSGQPAVHCSGSTTLLRMSRCEIGYGAVGVVFNQCQPKSDIRGTWFHDLTDYGLRIWGEGASPVVTNCVFEGIRNTAIEVGPDAAGAYLGNVKNLNPSDDGGNAFLDRDSWAVANNSPRLVRAQNNWWGFTTADEISSFRISDRNDSPSRGVVRFQPFLTEEPAQGPGAPTQPIGLTAMPTGAGGATICFSLASPAAVDVAVLNAAGRPVRQLCASRSLDAGAQAVTWDGRSDQGLRAPDGMYVVRVTAYGESGVKASGLAGLRLSRSRR